MGSSRVIPRRLSILDGTFLNIETRETPMHVGGLQVFRLPPNAPKDFVKNVVRTLRSPSALARPWNLKLADVFLSRLAPAMIEDPNIDLDYHVRHSALPEPGGERELGELVSHLHSQTLDRSRPLWTCHVIEGLEGNRFALYMKIHHALVDGQRGMKLLTRCLGSKPANGNWCAPWDAAAEQRKSSVQKTSGAKPPAGPAVAWTRAARNALAPLLRREPGKEPIRLPFEAPASILNGPVTGARRVATQRLELARVKAVAAHYQASVNDVFLTLCGAALRRHLSEGGSLPEQSLIAGVPVSLRGEHSSGDDGNAVGFLWAVLGTHLDDPVERLQAIRRSMEVSKLHLQSLPPKVRSALTMATMAPVIAVLMSGQGPRVRPSMNVVISNVPGPAQPLYLGRAELEGMYPVSIPLQGLGLNITCVSYAGQLTLGITGSRDGVPHLQRIAVYIGAALDELETSMVP
ncbi:wax ester/triacylglycerol synthase family O-acyltransferase [Sinimarinibacterium sp. CAU 1509]|uniref:WS/DGAT/MGAT family O-acyltransferase n=1 Tax=Sinimarinibacterium sp. CAU 1509 TaxID=2562283 RepID=UPI0010AC89D8|nr:wax ester/triacylglycerol synthase family O-acyltransferase [Sinimarinibacterium sp. CAU 1509]TJY64685.1 wax ester/triacylglycerol synthase family O-acyltransferase [Sinimarinibacterium sp. CAU 1509]